MSGDIDSLKKKYALSESAANLDSRDHIYSPSAVMEKLKAEMINSDVSIIRFTASSSTANAICMLISYINESDLFSLFTINEASKYVFNEVF